MQNNTENVTKIHAQICFLYPSFHLCNIIKFFFSLYDILFAWWGELYFLHQNCH